jgi:hypothetical protein
MSAIMAKKICATGGWSMRLHTSRFETGNEISGNHISGNVQLLAGVFN